jgi:ribosomal-protein-alanine N-acetyltransferase
MINVRPMQEEDVEDVMAIENVVCEFPWTADIFRDCIKVGYSCWVIEENQLICGYALLSVSAGEGHVLNICIDPVHQRKGLGMRLMKHLIEQARILKADTVYLEVRVSNTGAFDLYRKLGFIVIGHRKEYYPAKAGREDAIVLAISLR